MNFPKNSEHENIKCRYEVYQADVYTKQRHRPIEEGFVYPIKTYIKEPACCCPDDLAEASGKGVFCDIDEQYGQFDCDTNEIKKSKAGDPIGSDAMVPDEPVDPTASMAPGHRNDQRRRFYQKREYDDNRRKKKPDCCAKRACKRSSSDCSGNSTLSSSSHLAKVKRKKERRERKEKMKEEKRQIRSSIKEIKRKKKLLRMKSKCTCVKSLRRLNDKCCTTSTDLVYNPRLLKCQGTTTDTIVKQRVPKLKLRTRSPVRIRSRSPPKIRARSPKKIPPSKFRNNQLKTTGPKFSCCTCKKPFIQDQLPLHNKVEEPQMDRIEEPQMVRVEERIEEKDELSTDQMRSSVFENQEENKIIDYPRQSINLERKEENIPTVSQVQSTVFEPQKQPTEDNTQPYYQQLILNRNINIYLQIEKFCKQKPILLSRRQYDRVKKVLDGKIGTSKSWKNKRSSKCCYCTVGDVREKEGETEINDAETVHANVCTLNRAEQASQNTSWLFMTTKNESVQKAYSITTAQIKSTGVSPKQSLIQQIYQDAGPTTERNKIKEFTNVKQNTKKTQYKVPEPIRHTENVINYIKKGDKTNNSSGLKVCAQCGQKNFQVSKYSSCNKKGFKQYMDNENVCNICRMVQDLEEDVMYPMEKQKSSTRRAASSAEIHYANINTEKRVTFSSSYLDGNFVRQASSHFLLKKHSSTSLYTLFKGKYT